MGSPVVDKLVLRDCEGWFVIERAEHDGRSWVEPRGPGVSAFMTSARFSDADVEGDAGHMLGIAGAIEARGTFSAKRCSVDATAEPVRFSSPRNSQRDGFATLAAADDLAKQIRAAVKAGA